MLNHHRYGNGRPLVLQHGFLGGGGYWAPQLPTFGRHFDVIAPDLPGFAGSAHIEAPTTIKGFSSALVALLDELNVEQSALVGHSMGGMIALQTALDHPQRIERLVLYGSACTGNLPKRFETFDTSIARLRDDGVEACAERIVPTWFVEGDKAPNFAMCHEAGRGTSVDSAVRALGALREWDVYERLGELRMPVLVICGDRDRSTAPDESYRLHEAIAGSQLCVLPGCAHNVHLERPELFAAIVLEFLSAS
ncbi:MAG: 2-hydroxy-6-oxonona-2,4-dienedioate hydrolase [Gammaproteobacteria bacterium]|jgi:2-hydroxy-6-oxonona-2,4-dienedioate hydrolase